MLASLPSYERRISAAAATTVGPCHELRQLGAREPFGSTASYFAHLIRVHHLQLVRLLVGVAIELHCLPDVDDFCAADCDRRAVRFCWLLIFVD